MNVALRTPITREQFLDWVQQQDGRFEFDGVQPVAMTGGSRNHSRAATSIYSALQTRLRDPCEALIEAGVATGTAGVRYPDVLVTCTPGPGTDLLMPNPVVVFEVLSSSSGPTDLRDKVQEYWTVPSIRRYVVMSLRSIELTVFERDEQEWARTVLTKAGTLHMPEIGVEVPVAELYRAITLPDA